MIVIFVLWLRCVIIVRFKEIRNRYWRSTSFRFLWTSFKTRILSRHRCAAIATWPSVNPLATTGIRATMRSAACSCSNHSTITVSSTFTCTNQLAPSHLFGQQWTLHQRLMNVRCRFIVFGRIRVGDGRTFSSSSLRSGLMLFKSREMAWGWILSNVRNIGH